MGTRSDKPLVVGLVQINNSFSGQNYFPYSVGILQAYAQKTLPCPERFRFLTPLYSRLPVLDAAARLEGADLVAFSVYVWNHRISLRIAEILKARRPGTLIVFGGPHVPNDATALLKDNPFIDIACHGEGEQVFAAILENTATRHWQAVPSISYRGADGGLFHNPPGERLGDLSRIPSPYLSGIFDPLMRENPKENWIALWETSRGCPFSCTFCDWGSATASRVFSWEIDRLRREVDWFADHKVEYVFCADANFGILSRDVDVARYVADVKKSRGFPMALSVQNAKNATERSYLVQKILSDAGLNKGVVVSLQSVDATTLKAIKRNNIKLDTYYEIQRRFAAEGVETMSDLILALPGETYESFSRGVGSIIEKGQHNRIQFNNLSILPNAEMGNPGYQEKYGLVTVETKVVNIHGELDDAPDEPFETQRLVIATRDMPKDDWVKTRAFCWMAGFLHFDKLLQIPLVLLHEKAGLSYEGMIKAFADAHRRPDGRPLLAEIAAFFEATARGIQAGGPEYCHSKEWLGIWWPADEYIFIRLSVEGRLGRFYAEAQGLLEELLRESGKTLSALPDAVRLNQALMKQPFQTADLDVPLAHNVWDFYRSVLEGRPVPLEPVTAVFRVDRTRDTWDSWADWFRRVVWWGNKKGAYLYGNASAAKERAGHF